MRKKEILDRESWEACLANLDGDDQENLRQQLLQWQGGDTCIHVEVTVDCVGRIDSESSPRPAIGVNVEKLSFGLTSVYPCVSLVEPAEPYKPVCGDVNWGAGRFLQPLPDPLVFPGFIVLTNVTAHPFHAMTALRIETADMMVEGTYQCPYTKYDHFGIVPTAVISENVEAYRPALKHATGLPWDADFMLDHDFHRSNHTDEQLAFGDTVLLQDVHLSVGATLSQKAYREFPGLFELTSIQKSLIGPGYTSGTLKTDGHGKIKTGKIELDNGDWLFVHFWEWYNK
jgi:hypothetical protein